MTSKEADLIEELIYSCINYHISIGTSKAQTQEKYINDIKNKLTNAESKEKRK